MIMRKGIILAGGSGSRLHPLTLTVSKQLMPIYDKPMIYYPLSTLMLAGIKEILVITTPQDLPLFQHLLKDGKQWGISIEYATQQSPDGLAQAFIIGEQFIGNSPVTLILGDNIFYGEGLAKKLQRSSEQVEGATVFGYFVKDPERYGVATFSSDGKVTSIDEKPKNPQSNYAITGLYFYDNNVVDIAKQIKPSQRGELEITDVNMAYLQQQSLTLELLNRGNAWLDTGTHQALLDASIFIKVIEDRQGLKISCPEEIALRIGYITLDELAISVQQMKPNNYTTYLQNLISERS